MQNNDLIRKLLTLYVNDALQDEAWGQGEDVPGEDVIYRFFGNHQELMYIFAVLRNDPCVTQRVEKLVKDRDENGYLTTWAPGMIMNTLCPALSKKACTCTKE